MVRQVTPSGSGTPLGNSCLCQLHTLVGNFETPKYAIKHCSRSVQTKLIKNVLRLISYVSWIPRSTPTKRNSSFLVLQSLALRISLKLVPPNPRQEELSKFPIKRRYCRDIKFGRKRAIRFLSYDGGGMAPFVSKTDALMNLRTSLRVERGFVSFHSLGFPSAVYGK